ncbi:hypothetical protein EPN90_00290 [Patescibacteria group bacterium]|nr:MAG: hypothetical protein EPN90_00290 [Patescibacteria group bacterium]
MRRWRRAFAPRRGFKAALWRGLSRELGPAASSPFLVFARVAVPALSLFLAFGGVSAYAYSSPEVTPEHPLYAVKRGVEGLDKVMAIGAKAREAARLRRLDHRLAEAERLRLKKRNAQKSLAEINRELEAGNAAAAEVVRSEPTRGMVEGAEEDIFERLENLTVQSVGLESSGVPNLISEDARRIKRRLTRTPEPAARRFLEARLERRQQALENVAIRIEEGEIEPPAFLENRPAFAADLLEEAKRIDEPPEFDEFPE